MEKNTGKEEEENKKKGTRKIRRAYITIRSRWRVEKKKGEGENTEDAEQEKRTQRKNTEQKEYREEQEEDQ